MARVATQKRPGRPPGSRRGSRESRMALLDAALAIFTERGYRGASVDAIATAAGLSKGTFYWNFASKRELFETLIEERLDRPIRELAELISAAAAEADASLEANRLFAELVEHERETILLNAEYWALAARDQEMRRRFSERHAKLRDALALALEQRARTLGAPPFDPPASEVATAFLALSAGLARTRLVDPEAVPGGLLGEMFALVYAGLVATSSAAG